MKIKVLILLSILCIAKISSAQVDTEFWFAVPEVSSSHADRPVVLRVTALDNPTLVIIDVPSNPNITPFATNVAANSIGTIDLTFIIDSLENLSPNIPLNRGLRITANEPIKAYYEVLGFKNSSELKNSEIFVLKGRYALGKEFYTPFQNIYDNATFFGVNNAFSSIDVVAIEDFTTITFNPTNPVFNKPNGPITVTLMRGQTYSIRAASTNAQAHLGGTKINSNKPIAVTLKDDSVIDESKDVHLELVGDQIVPIRELGTEYVYIDGEVFIVGTEDSTEISINGNYQSTINAGEQEYYFANGGGNFIETTKPVYVFQLHKNYYEMSGGHLNHLNCTGDKEISVLKSSPDGMDFYIVAKSGSEGNFSTNFAGIIITAANFQPIPGTTDWVSANISVFNQNQIPSGSTITITNSSDKFHLGYKIGNDLGSARFGYFASSSTLDFDISESVCDSIILDAGFNRDSYLWSTGETTQSIIIDTTGEYWAKVTEDGCEAEDTINIIVNPGPLVKLREDTSICLNDTIILSHNYDTLSYLWSTGETTPSINATKPGTYVLVVSNQFECVDRDTVIIEPVPFPSLGIPKDTIACKDELILNINDTLSNPIWLTLNGDIYSNNKSALFNKTTTLTVQAQNECGIRKDSLVVEFREHVVPNVITPNNDGVNEDFIIDNLGSGEWELRIYDRWGNLHYKDEKFIGQWEKVNFTDQIYFTLLKDKTCNQTYKNWLQILR